MLADGKITEEEALANSDSPTNLLWLLNNAAGPTDTTRNVEKKSSEPEGASFTEFTLDA
jgi:twitching motility protein PilU